MNQIVQIPTRTVRMEHERARAAEISEKRTAAVRKRWDKRVTAPEEERNKRRTNFLQIGHKCIYTRS